MTRRMLVTNCRLFDRLQDKQTASILIEKGTIARVGQVDTSVACERVLDAQGLIAAPGFIDVHIQGAGGYDVLDGTEEALRTISKTCARFGVTGFLATTVFKPGQENQHLRLAAKYVGRDLGGANLLGIHLEGPFISKANKGMISSECITEPSVELLQEIYDLTKGHLKMMTIAPEIPGSLKIIECLVADGTIASFGHSEAVYEQTLDGFKAGISHVTHLFNAMSSLHHRSPGPLLAIFENKDVTTQLITDGVHIHPAVLRFAFDTLGPNRIIPITDGMKAIGLANGKYIYNGVEYESKDGTARYKDGTLIGTALGLGQVLKRFVTYTGCPLDVSIKTVTENPARVLGIEEKKGSIQPGKDADIALLDEDCSIYATIVDGKIVFEDLPGL
jgi:N-acetylglucosamine-6-phosphate deacetylase